LKQFILIVLSILLFIVSALFFAQNDQVVNINYFVGQIAWQLNWVMLVSLCVGFLLGVMSLVGALFSSQLQLKILRSKLEKREQELTNLRSLPVKDEY